MRGTEWIAERLCVNEHLLKTIERKVFELLSSMKLVNRRRRAWNNKNSFSSSVSETRPDENSDRTSTAEIRSPIPFLQKAEKWRDILMYRSGPRFIRAKVIVWAN